QDLVLRQFGHAAERNLRMARGAANRERRDDVVRGRVGNEVKRRVGNARADEVDAAFAEAKALADRVKSPALQLQAASGLWIGGRAMHLYCASQLRVQAVARNDHLVH